MSNKINIKNLTIVFLLITFLAGQPSQALAFGWGRPPMHHFRTHGSSFNMLPFAAATLIIAGMSYYYWQGEFYRRERERYVVIPAPVGAVVTTIPSGYQPVIIDGTPYYIINGVTYMYTPYGYQVVPQPKTIIIQNNADQQTPQVIPDQSTSGVQNTPVTNTNNSFTVNIPNAKRGYTAVTLKRSGTGFVGPQGEYYSEFPRIEQLKVMYAK
jgi:hypothetical protein